MPFQITEAIREKLKLRLAITGPSGAGKTWTAMMLAQRIAERENTRFCVIDTEHESAKLYASLFTVAGKRCGHIDFGAPFSPDRYIDAMETVEKAGFGVMVIDSLSHAWSGEGGALQLVDELGAVGRGGKFASGWGQVTPMQNRMIERMLQSPLHIIATMRSKQEHAMDQQTGKVTKLGMAPVQRDGVDYEFAVVLDMDTSQRATVSKSRCTALPMGKVIPKPKPDVADTLMDWLNEGADPETPEPPKSPTVSTPSPTSNGNGAHATTSPSRSAMGERATTGPASTGVPTPSATRPATSPASASTSTTGASDDGRARFWAKAQEMPQFSPDGKFSKKLVHQALGIPLVDGALAEWVAKGNSYQQAETALKLGIPIVKQPTEPTAGDLELDAALNGSAQPGLGLDVAPERVSAASAPGSH